MPRGWCIIHSPEAIGPPLGSLEAALDMQALLTELNALLDQQEQLTELGHNEQWWANQERVLEIMNLLDA